MIDADLTPARLETLRNESGRAVFADSLSEAHDPRGEFITVQLRLADPRTPTKERRALLARERALLAMHQAVWLRDFPPSKRAAATLRRGFIEHLAVNLYLTEEHDLTELLASAPLTDSLELYGVVGGLIGVHQPRELTDILRQAIARAPAEIGAAGRQLRHFAAHHLKLHDDQLPALLNVAPQARELDLRNNQLGLLSARRVSERSLTSLCLANNRIGPAGGEAVLRSKTATDLQLLDLSNNGVTASAFAQAASFPHLASVAAIATAAAARRQQELARRTGPRSARRSTFKGQ